MDRSRVIVVGLGAWLILMAVLSPVFADVFTPPNDFFGFFYSVCAFFVFLIVGTTVLIVGLTRSDRRHQQQQQQVVIMGPPAASGYAPAPSYAAPALAQTRLKCPRCATLNAAEARFCKQCGVPFGGGAR